MIYLKKKIMFEYESISKKYFILHTYKLINVEEPC